MFLKYMFILYKKTKKKNKIKKYKPYKLNNIWFIFQKLNYELIYQNFNTQ